jgi:hypothetical protein
MSPSPGWGILGRYNVNARLDAADATPYRVVHIGYNDALTDPPAALEFLEHTLKRWPPS